MMFVVQFMVTRSNYVTGEGWRPEGKPDDRVAVVDAVDDHDARLTVKAEFNEHVDYEYETEARIYDVTPFLVSKKRKSQIVVEQDPLG